MSNKGKPEKIKGNQELVRACYLAALNNSNHKRLAETPPSERKKRRIENKAKKDQSTENLEGRTADLPRPSAEGETEEISLELNRQERMVKIETDLDDDVKVNLISLVRNHADVFAFSADEISELTRHS